MLLGFPEPPDPDVVYIESQTGSLYLEKPPDVQRYTAMCSHLVARALGPDESRTMLAGMAADLA